MLSADINRNSGMLTFSHIFHLEMTYTTYKTDTKRNSLHITKQKKKESHHRNIKRQTIGSVNIKKGFLDAKRE